jgi:hypothetical protein
MRQVELRDQEEEKKIFNEESGPFIPCRPNFLLVSIMTSFHYFVRMIIYVHSP